MVGCALDVQESFYAHDSYSEETGLNMIMLYIKLSIKHHVSPWHHAHALTAAIEQWQRGTQMHHVGPAELASCKWTARDPAACSQVHHTLALPDLPKAGASVVCRKCAASNHSRQQRLACLCRVFLLCHAH